MIEYLGIAAPQDVGYYSGMVDSAFSLVQALTVRTSHTRSAVVLHKFLTSHDRIPDLLLVLVIEQDWPQTSHYHWCSGRDAQFSMLRSQSFSPCSYDIPMSCGSPVR